jgi:CheY-like chemotaxis protein
VKRIFVIDDDLAMEAISDAFRYRGYEADRINSASTALKRLDEIATADLVILDIIMPWPAEVPAHGMAGDRTAGMEVFRGIRAKNATLPIIAYSGTQDGSIIEALGDDPHTKFMSKWESHSLKELVTEALRRLGLEDVQKPTVFIVHGHNDKEKLSLKNFLQNKLHLPEPIILHEKPNIGRTIIEKFEHYASQSSLVFILLTPDDVGAAVGDANDLKRRGRQNVIFEMGYFLGQLGRLSGRVLLLHQGPLELPSDLLGVIYIDISNGVDAVGEQIRLELENVR